MAVPTAGPPVRHATTHPSRTVSRRAFLGFCTAIAAALAVPEVVVSRALAGAKRLPVVWLGLQDCTGDTESFLRAVEPDVTSLLFDVISLDYHESLMAAAGARTADALTKALAGRDYVCVVEGSIPTADGGAHCMIGGESALSLVRRVVPGAVFTIAAGTCSCDGGLAAAAPNPTGAVGVAEAVPDIGQWMAMPGCPVNGVNLAAAIVAYLADGQLPTLDAEHRPTFAYGQRVHGASRCERFEHLRAGETVEAWGDEGHRKGFCLIEMGCHGPTTYANCYQRNWNSGSWPVGTGSICVGCTTSGFWDKNTPFFVRASGSSGGGSSNASPSPGSSASVSPSPSATASPGSPSSSSAPVPTAPTEVPA